MSNAIFSDLEIMHECQSVLEKYVRLAENEIAAKLSGCETVSGGQLIVEFESSLKDHINDIMGDTLDAWSSEFRNQLEDEFGVSVSRSHVTSFPQAAE
jgi:hypothetical protein